MNLFLKIFFDNEKSTLRVLLPIIVSIIIASFVFYHFENINVYFILSWILLIFLFFRFIFGLSERIVYLELFALYSTVCNLISPSIIYLLGNPSEYSMRLSATEYYNYAFFANLLFVVSLLYNNKNNNQEIIIERAKVFGNENLSFAFLIFFLGFFAQIFVDVAPVSLRQVIAIMGNFMFAGLIMVYYSKSKFKIYLFVITFLLLSFKSAQSAMFGDLLFVSVTTAILVFSSLKIKLSTRIIFICTGLYIMMVIQSLKAEYRILAWREQQNNYSDQFSTLFFNYLINPQEVFAPERQIQFWYRLGQGVITSDVMDKVPDINPYGFGETYIVGFINPFVLRYFWSDKREAGGYYNVCRFLNSCDNKDRGMSFNIGLLGEAYANFGAFGGIAMLIVLGFSIRILLHNLIYIKLKHYIFFFFVPSFFQSMLPIIETDFLGSWGGIVQLIIIIGILNFLRKALS